MTLTPEQEQRFAEWWTARGKRLSTALLYLRLLHRIPDEGTTLERVGAVSEGSRSVAASALEAWDSFLGAKPVAVKSAPNANPLAPVEPIDVYTDFELWLTGVLGERVARSARRDLQSSTTLQTEVSAKVLGWWLRFCAIRDVSPAPHVEPIPRWALHAAWLIGTAIHDYARVNSGSGDILWDKRIRFATGRGWPENVGTLDFSNFMRPPVSGSSAASICPLDLVMPNGHKLPDIWALWGPPLFRLAAYNGIDPAAVAYPTDATRPGATGPLLTVSGRPIGAQLLKLYLDAQPPFTPDEAFDDVPLRVLEVGIRYQQEVAHFMRGRTTQRPPVALLTASCVSYLESK